MSTQISQPSPLRLLAILEATTVNAVAKNVLDFCQCVAALNLRGSGSAPIDVSVVTFVRGPISDSDHVAPNAFVTVARLHGITIDLVRERFRFDLRVVPELKSLVARRDPDIIVTHNVKSHFLARLCRLHRNRPWVAFHHGYTTMDLKNRAYNELDRWSLAAADRVVAVCGPFARQLQERGIPAERIVVQHNSIGSEPPVRAKDIHEVREGLAMGEGERLLVAIGRLSREKGHIDLISAFAKVRAMHPEVRAKLAIVGEGPERSALESAIRVRGLGNDVRLMGHRNDVRPYYAAADLFVLPSRSEGSPYVLLEAMRAGVPIVATAVGGVPEILMHEQTALLVAPQDSESLAAAIGRILNDSELAERVSANASTLVSRSYSLENYVSSMSRIYRSLALGSASRHLQTA